MMRRTVLLTLLVAGCARPPASVAPALPALRGDEDPRASAQVGTYQAWPDVLPQVGPTPAGPGRVFSVGDWPSTPVSLREGPGRTAVASYCSLCHSAHMITQQPRLSAKTWEKEVDKMVRTYGAPIPEAAVPEIQGYLQDQYGKP